MPLSFVRPFAACSADALAAAEAEIGIAFPDDYRRLLAAQNGGARPSPAVFGFVGVDGRPTSSMLAKLLGVGLPARDDLVAKWRMYAGGERIPADVLPVAEDIAGNLVCLGTTGARAGKVYFWDHEFELAREGHANLAFIADDLDAFLASLTDA